MRQLTGFFRESLGRRLLLYFTLLMMIPLAAVGWIIYEVSDARMSTSALRLTSQIMDNVSMDLEQMFDDTANLSAQVVADNMIQGYIAQTPVPPADTHELALQMSQRLKRLASYYDDINGVYLLLDNGMVAKSRYYAEREQHRIPDELYQRARNHAGVQWVTSPEGSLMVDNMGSGVLCALSSLTNAGSGRPCGVVVVEVKLSAIQKMLQVDMGENSNLYLLSPQGEILQEQFNHPEQQAVARELMENEVMSTRLRVFEQEDFFVLCQRFPAGGCAVMGLVYKDFIREDSRKILEAVLLVAAFAFVINIVVSQLLKRYELQPIEEMMQYVRRVEAGDFSADIKTVRTDEMGKLAASMCEMTRHIENLLETVQREQTRLRWAEFKALQAQINPHFLYNTLDSIKWLVRQGNNEQAGEMIDALTLFFRKVLSQGKDFITIDDEVSHIKSYLTIQKIRYYDLFDYYIYIEDGLETCVIPKLLLQPLVENALYHGIKPCGHKGELLINVVSVGEDLVLEVRDNGVGMPPEKKERLRQSIQNGSGKSAESYGMANVNERIHILSGREYGISLQSDENVGSSVRITLPKTLKGDE